MMRDARRSTMFGGRAAGVAAALMAVCVLASCSLLGSVSPSPAPAETAAVAAPVAAAVAKASPEHYAPVMPEPPAQRNEEELLAEADLRSAQLRNLVEREIASVAPGPFPESLPPAVKKAPASKAASAPPPAPAPTPAPAARQAVSVLPSAAKPSATLAGGNTTGLSTLARYTTQEGLPNNLVTAVYVDETDAWVGTSGGGVGRYNFAEKNWILTGEAEGLISNFVTDLAKFKGKLYVGTKKGVSVWDGVAWSNLIEQDRVLLQNTTFRQQAGELWIAARNMRGGLLSFDGEKWRNMSGMRPGLLLNNVSALDFDGKEIWIGTTSRGVLAFRNNDWMSYTVAEGITSNFVYTLAVKKGKAFLGGCCGLSYFDGERWSVFDVPEGLPHSTVNAIVWDGDIVWLGTKNGLSAFNGSEFVNYYVEDGLLADNHVTSLFVRGDEVWVGTIGGLSRLRKE